MIYYVIKVCITTGLIVAISEIAKRSTLAAAVLASIPLVSVLAILWLYVDTGNVAEVSDLTTSIFWLVLPSLVLFVSLPLLLKQGLHFYASMGVSIGLTVGCYWLVVDILNR